MKKTIAAAALAAALIGALGACGETTSDPDTKGTNNGNGGTSVNTAPDEADDVLKITRTDEKYLGSGVEVLVKNTSSKTSDYVIEITAESANGKKALDSATILIENVKPGQKATGDSLFLKMGSLPDDAKITVGSVDRMESL